MHPHEFAQKWREASTRLSERAGYQEHWRDLCQLLGEPTPTQATQGTDYAFERSVKKLGTGEQGFADVYLQDHFIVEYKAAGRDLNKAWQQGLLYAAELGNPPLIITCDFLHLRLHTNFTGVAPRTVVITLDDIERDAQVAGDLTALQVLRAMFHDPGLLDPRLMRARVTEAATAQIGAVGQALTKRGVPQATAAHFLMRVVFAMFSEDIGLLPKGLLTKVLKRVQVKPEGAQGYFSELFSAMHTGGEFWGEDIRHFNGGLFDTGDALPLTAQDASALLVAATLDWAQVEPAIFGTLFENSLDATIRSKRGAHYTSVQDILRITTPVMMDALRAEWDQVKAQAGVLASKKSGKQAALTAVMRFHTHLAGVTVLDPACGSGNFLVVALTQLLDFEQEVRTLGAELGAGPFAMPPHISPRNLRGIEIEPFAHELASVSVWIAYFQWKAAHGGDWDTPVLQALPGIQQQDALLTDQGQEQEWPDADFIMGNPPFLGAKKLRAQLGEEYTAALWGAYEGRVPRSADLVTYWLEKARDRIEHRPDVRAGFVTTNSVRQPKSRPVLERIARTGAFFDAWPDLPWLQDGAAVRVSVMAFDAGHQQKRRVHLLQGEGTPAEQVVSLDVPVIHADLSAGSPVTQAAALAENSGRSFQGVKLVGPFDLTAAEARVLLEGPNPSGVSNADVVKPYLDGDDITRGLKDRWVIDFAERSREMAQAYVQPFALVEQRVKPVRAGKAADKVPFWRFLRPRGEMRLALAGLERFIVTSEVAKHRLFVWAMAGTVPSGSLVVLAFDDDVHYGVLSSRVHTVWAKAMGQTLEDRPRYTPSTCFETFPFPHPDEGQRAEIEKWARYVVQLRAHLLGQNAKATLTGLYNDVENLRATPDAAHPVSALVTAHARLDQAVAAAYGWDWPLAEDEILSRLLTLNLARVIMQYPPY